VAAGILPAVEPGVPPGGPSPTSKARNHSPSGCHPLGKQFILALENFRIPSASPWRQASCLPWSRASLPVALLRPAKLEITALPATTLSANKSFWHLKIFGFLPFPVAAGILPAVEPGVPPGGHNVTIHLQTLCCAHETRRQAGRLPPQVPINSSLHASHTLAILRP